MNETVNKLIKSYSTYVVLFLVSAATYWLNLSPEERQALLTAYPVLSKLVPAAGFIAFLAARAVPQPSVTGDDKPKE